MPAVKLEDLQDALQAAKETSSWPYEERQLQRVTAMALVAIVERLERIAPTTYDGPLGDLPPTLD